MNARTALWAVAAVTAPAFFFDGYRTVVTHVLVVIGVACWLSLIAFLVVVALTPKIPPFPGPDATTAELDAWCRAVYPEMYERRSGGGSR